MKQAAVAGFAAGIAMMVGGALGAVSHSDPKPAWSMPAIEIMNPMIGGQAMLPDRDIMDNMAASPMHTTLAAAMKDTGVASALKSQRPVHRVRAHQCRHGRGRDTSPNPPWRGA